MNGERTMDKAFRAIRVITVPPVFALVFLLVVYGKRPGVFASAGQCACAVLFLGALPILGYPLQKCIPYFRDKGREGQRSLAMICSATGYLLGFASAAMSQASRALVVIYLEYLLCGIAMLVFNRGLSSQGKRPCLRHRGPGPAAGRFQAVRAGGHRSAADRSGIGVQRQNQTPFRRAASRRMPDRRRLPGRGGASALTLIKAAHAYRAWRGRRCIFFFFPLDKGKRRPYNIRRLLGGPIIRMK